MAKNLIFRNMDTFYWEYEQYNTEHLCIYDFLIIKSEYLKLITMPKCRSGFQKWRKLILFITKIIRLLLCYILCFFCVGIYHYALLLFVSRLELPCDGIGLFGYSTRVVPKQCRQIYFSNNATQYLNENSRNGYSIILQYI